MATINSIPKPEFESGSRSIAPLHLYQASDESALTEEVKAARRSFVLRSSWSDLFAVWDQLDALPDEEMVRDQQPWRERDFS